MKQSLRGMVEKIDFYTSFGHGDGGDHRQRLGIDTKGPTLLITDLAVWKPRPETQGIHGGLAASRRDAASRCRRTAAGRSRFAERAGDDAAADDARTDDAARPAGPHQGGA